VALEDDTHPLHGLRGRIIKDGWIAQAHGAAG
jgi:predicted flap endonuclease-1-like 5' DNA nuclease